MFMPPAKGGEAARAGPATVVVNAAEPAPGESARTGPACRQRVPNKT